MSKAMLKLFRITIFIVSLYMSTTSYAQDNTIYHNSKDDEYAKIAKNNQASFDALSVLMDKKAGDKKAIANSVANDLQHHTPPTIMAAAMYFLSVEDVDQYAILYSFGNLRANIDVDASRDPALEG